MIASKSGMTSLSSSRRRHYNNQLLISFMDKTTGPARGAASTASKIERNVTLGLAAADQQIAIALIRSVNIGP
jgi:hypothetical protein